MGLRSAHQQWVKGGAQWVPRMSRAELYTDTRLRTGSQTNGEGAARSGRHRRVCMSSKASAPAAAPRARAPRQISGTNQNKGVGPGEGGPHVWAAS